MTGLIINRLCLKFKSAALFSRIGSVVNQQLMTNSADRMSKEDMHVQTYNFKRTGSMHSGRQYFIRSTKDVSVGEQVHPASHNCRISAAYYVRTEQRHSGPVCAISPQISEIITLAPSQK